VTLEREVKFSLAAAEPPDPWVLAYELERAGFTLQAQGSLLQRDRYVDTPDGRLAQAGLALRERRIGEQRLVTLKWAGSVHGGIHYRQELEREAAGWPPEVLAALPAGVTLGELVPQLALATRRTRYRVWRAGKALAELAVDEVDAQRPDQDASAHFLEIELEAVEAGSEELSELAEALRAILPVNDTSVSKLERALALLPPPEARR
jgi:inorganic triphosphatase YgiF